MGIELKEYLGAKFVSVNNVQNKIKNLSESYVETCIDDDSLMVEIEGIHSIITRNDTYYTPECLKDSIPLWTNPYERPVIMHHNEKDGKTIGRVKAVNLISHSKRSETAALEFITNIGDDEGKKGIKNGTLATVSIGAIAHDIRCSICGQNLVEDGFCEHDKGETYEGKRCYWIINKIEPKEISFVIVPSDIYAHSTRVYPAVNKKNNKNNGVKESMFGNENIFHDLSESIKAATGQAVTEETEVTEGSQIEEEVKDNVKTGETEKVEEPKKEEGEKESKKDEEVKTEETPKKDEKDPKENPEEDKKGEEVKTDSKDQKVEETPKEESKKDEEPKKEEESAKEDIEALKKEIADLKSENEKLKRAVENEKTLKESAEAELISFRAAKKKALVESVNTLRKELGLKEEDQAVLTESTDEALELSIKSLKEFRAVHRSALGGLNVIESPVAVSDEKDNTQIETKKIKADVKESVFDSNKEFEEKFFGVLENAFGAAGK